MRTRSLILLLIAGLLLVGSCTSHDQAPADAPPPPPAKTPEMEKIKVDSLDDLTAHSYELKGTVAESDLATYEITEAATLQGVYSTLVTLNMIEGRDGGTMKMSGTSMASPNVCNLAAKLFTLKPGLTPTQVVDLIGNNADPHAKSPDILLMNPRAVVAALN